MSGSYRDLAAVIARMSVDQVRRAIALPVTNWPAQEAGLNI